MIHDHVVSDVKTLWPARADLAEAEGAAAQVYAARLDGPAAMTLDYASVLSVEERARADRFRFTRDRRRFIAGRGALRAILGAYANTSPAALRFSYGPHGKPALEGFDAIHFNVAHSEDLLVVGVAASPIGIDVEWVRPMPDLDLVAQRHFSPRELDALGRFADGERIAAFFACWTRKEAYLKALGSGLARPLDAFGVSCAPDAESCRVDDPAVTTSWRIWSSSPVTGAIAAVALEDRAARPCYAWRRTSAATASADPSPAEPL